MEKLADVPGSNRLSAAIVPLPATQMSPGGGKPQPLVTFDRRELQQILTVYGRKVAAGEWRDYALDFLKDRALFSIYARVSDRPAFVVEKDPRLRSRQGQYLVTNQQGRVLRRGHDLAQVLRVLDPHLAVIG